MESPPIDEDLGEVTTLSINEVELDGFHADDTIEDSNEIEDSPPTFKYSRLSLIPSHFFMKDHISTCYFTETHFIFATHMGLLYITDPEFRNLRSVKVHRATVLSLYADSKYFISGLIDGTVVIGSFNDENDIIAYDFKRPVHAVALDKNYSKSKLFVSGGMEGKVILSSRSWLGQRTDVILEEGHGPIVSISIVDDVLVWMNDKGISVYNVYTKKFLKEFPRPENAPRADLYWPRVTFPESNRILIAWGNYIWSLVLTPKQGEYSNKLLSSAASISFRNYPEKEVALEHIYELGFIAAGICSYKDEMWMVLSYEPPTEENGISIYNNPDIKLIDSANGQVEFEEEIGLNNIEHLGPNDYSLGVHYGAAGPTRFIICATDGVVVKDFQMNDRLEWFMEEERYLDAWNISEHLLSPLKRLNVGLQHIDNLVKINKWDEASKFLGIVLNFDEKELLEADTRSLATTMVSIKLDEQDSYVREKKAQWANWCSIFIDTKHFQELTDIIPTDQKAGLSPDIYFNILRYWLESDRNKFLEIIDSWDQCLYPVNELQSLVEDELTRDAQDEELRKSLIESYRRSNEPEKAVPHLIALRSTEVINYLAMNHLLASHINNLPSIIRTSFPGSEIETLPIEEIEKKVTNAIDVLIEFRHELTPETIIDLFKRNLLDFMNLFYLEKLVELDDLLTTRFGDERIQLYSKYKRLALLPFMMNNENYDVNVAIAICEENEFTDELLYLWGKIGESKKALFLIMKGSNDPVKALDFVKRLNEKEIWDLFLEHSIQRPHFIKVLLEGLDESTEQFYDPVSILQQLPEGMDIDKFRDSVVKILKKNEVSLLLNQLILGLVLRNTDLVAEEFILERLRGFEIDVAELKEQKILGMFKNIKVFRQKDLKLRYEF